jgi:hypothetical protein
LAANVGGYNVAASADSLISSTGDFIFTGGTLASTLTDSDPGTYAYSDTPGASVTLGFSSGIENGAGADFVLFELGTPDTFDVTVNGVTLSGISAATGVDAGGYSLNATSFDLADFGVASGASVSSLLIGLDTQAGSGTVPSLSYAGALNVSAAPEPSTWLLMIAGVSGVGLMLRRAKRALGLGLAVASAA